MKAFLFVLGFAVLLVFGIGDEARGQTVLMHQDFEDAALFKADGIARHIEVPGGQWDGFDGRNFSIIEAAQDEGGRALKITRVSSGLLALKTLTTPPNDRAVVAHFRMYVGPANETAAVIRFRNAERDLTIGEIRFGIHGKIAGYIRGKRHFGLRNFPNEWQDLELRFSPNAEHFEIYNTGPDGKRHKGDPIPYENNVPIDVIEFINYPSPVEGKDNTILVGSVNVSYENVSSLVNRENILLSAYDTKAFVVSADGQARGADRLNDGDWTGASSETITELPGTLLFNLAQPALVSTVRMFSGDKDYVKYPSGEVAVTDFLLEGFSTASGQWRELVTVEDTLGFEASGATGHEDFFVVRDFEAIEVSQLRVTILDSNDTGRRADPDARPAKSAIVREVEVYTRHAVANTRKQLGNVLQAEFFVPVYRDQETASLSAVLDESFSDGIEVEIKIRERHTGVIPRPAWRVTLAPGENRIDFDISDWVTGEYRTELRASGTDAPVGGAFARLLRIDRVEPPAELQTLGDFTGQKIFLPDNRYLASHDAALKFTQVQPRVHRVGRPFLKPDKAIQLGDQIGFTSGGKLMVGFRDMNRVWDKKSSATHYAMADLSDLDQWEISDIRPTDFDTTPSALQHGVKSNGSSSGGVGGSFGDGERFRFYDREKDGPIVLSEMVVQHTGYKKVDWGVIQPPQQSTWLLWKKGDTWLILQDKPFLQDGMSSEEFEAPNNSNDNFAGQWISEDGKTFYYVRGRLLKRYPPFIARYDNLWSVARMLTVFSTQDGLTWEQRYFPPPVESDGPTAQHYGARIYSVPDANGLMISYTLAYSAYKQQMHLELYYSWDGAMWQRMAEHEPWIAPGQPDDWNFGATTLHPPVVERDGLMYHLIGWGSALPHFAEPKDYSGQPDGSRLEQRYGPRNLTDWPYFNHYGSYAKLAEALGGYGYTPGVMITRKDGWWALTAGDTEGQFTTRPMTASASLTVNARVFDAGYIKVALLGEDGTPLDGYVMELRADDDTVLPIFAHLPSVPFCVSVTMKNAELYTLNF